MVTRPEQASQDLMAVEDSAGAAADVVAVAADVVAPEDLVGWAASSLAIVTPRITPVSSGRT